MPRKVRRSYKKEPKNSIEKLQILEHLLLLNVSLMVCLCILRMYIRICTYTCVWTYACMYMHAGGRMRIYLHIYLYIYIHTYIHKRGVHLFAYLFLRNLTDLLVQDSFWLRSHFELSFVYSCNHRTCNVNASPLERWTRNLPT